MSSRAASALADTRFLLDTHAFLFLAQYPDRLPRRLRPVLEDPVNELHLSIASLWEIQIKVVVGKLALGGPLDRVLALQQRENQLSVLPVAVKHILEHAALPLHHRDPFDRMLVAQARVEGLTLLSRDATLARYDVAVRW